MLRSVASIAAVVLLAGFTAAAARAERTTSPRLMCRVFEVSLAEGAVWDSADAAHPIGRWAAEMQGQGWGIHTVQLTVGQKSTGYPQGYQQVCLSPTN